MKSLNNYIIQESFKDKIKTLINKFKKEKVPEKVYKEAEEECSRQKRPFEITSLEDEKTLFGISGKNIKEIVPKIKKLIKSYTS